ncbi:MAG: CRISPR-associated helicase Cas3' [Chitinivibrionales bacterium]
MIPDYLWAKTTLNDDSKWHPLVLHLLDVAAVAEDILNREPQATKKRFAEIFGLSFEDSMPWILLLIACHDIGKACPGFQLKWEKSKELLANTGIHLPRLPDTTINHAFVSQIALEKLLLSLNWPEDFSALCAEAVGCHHGTRATSNILSYLEGNRNGTDEHQWGIVWENIFNSLRQVFAAEKSIEKLTMSGPDFMLLAGLTSFADWIGSNEDWFYFGNQKDCINLSDWFRQRKTIAGTALDSIGWNSRTPLLNIFRSFIDAFPKCSPPRPLQGAVEKLVTETSSPCVMLIEAPMGEGKTEAAFYAHLELQRRFGHRGLYIAMPTKATGNAMFSRTLEFLQAFCMARTLDLQLLHGATQLNETFQNLRLGQIHSDEGQGSIQASIWFTYKKRALLSEYGVGTVDQALLTILPVRHYFVRLWGLANRVVIFDEIHAYDAYTGTLLFHLIRWLRALGSSVILLSATVTPEFRRKLADALGTKLPDQEAVYPRATMFADDNDKIKQIHFSADPTRHRVISIIPLEPSIKILHSCLSEKLPDSGFACVIVNTVQRAQDFFLFFGEGHAIIKNGIIVGKKLSDGTEIHLFHARYPAQERQQREDEILAVYGKNEKDGKLVNRKGRHILIATQVVEQSLDLDFDLLITDLAPIDLLLQRAGRVWRHQRDGRPIPQPILCVAGLTGNSPISFGDPLWWSVVYREDILIKTWKVLAKKQQIILPDEIDMLVNSVYEDFNIPSDDEIQKRLEKAEIENDGIRIAQQITAHQAIIGLPDDGSWKDTNRFYLYDEDEPGVHQTLRAQTRLGEDSVVAIPIFPNDNFDKTVLPNFLSAKQFALRAVSLSRKGVIHLLRQSGTPEGWKKTSLLRNCFPLIFDKQGNWIEDHSVKLDKELGIIYTPKEVQ